MIKCYSSRTAEQPLGRAHCHPCNVWKETLYLFQSSSRQPTKRHPELFWRLDSANHLSTVQKRCDHEIFWLHSKCAPTLFVVCLIFAWEMTRQKFPEIAVLGITSQDHIFKGNSGASKDQMSSNTFQQNHSVLLVHWINFRRSYTFYSQNEKARRSTAPHCGALKFK